MKYIAAIFVLVVLVMFMPDLAISQPPGFPSAPDQAPIDGGLTLLAAAGGAYALNKLRKRKA